MTHLYGMVIESFVALLLVVTICYCVVLNAKLRRLKADEQALKAVIAELITATEIAERAIAGLKVTVRECDQNIGERLRTAERFAADIDRQIVAGGEVLDRLVSIVSASRPITGVAPRPPAPPSLPEPPVSAPAHAAASTPDAHDMLAAAQAFANRTRSRTKGLAA